jgi:outer membrane protein assembly factor BamB
MKNITYFCFFLLILPLTLKSQQNAQWRGLNRNGVYQERGLLKSWPEAGPVMLWSHEDLGKGFSSASVTNKIIYVTGRKDSLEYLTALDLNGNRLWQIPYGLGVRKSYPGTRCTPTIEENKIYLISGRGEVVCVDAIKKKIQWSVPAFKKFQGKYWIWEIAESPLIVDDKIIYTPGGHLTTMVALDKSTGNTIWQTESLNDTSAFVSPILIQQGGKKIIVNVMINFIFGVDAENGKILWKVKYSDIQPPTFHPWAPRNNCITPLYHDGFLFITSGYDHVGVKFKLLNNGSDIEQVWINPNLDTHHGHVVLVDGYIYGANWIDNRNGNWCCVNWETGKLMYEKEWQCKGSIISAEGMLYCYEEKKGNLALVKASPKDFEIISSFRITQGSGPHWAHPVINTGILYIRHGNVLMAYDIKEQ